MSGMIDTKLGEICSFQNGRAFKKSEWCEVGLPIIRIANLTSRCADFNHFNGEYDEKIFIQNGDIIFSWSGSLKVEIWDRGNALLNQHLYKVGFTADVQKKWVYYLLLYSISYLSKKMTGATLQHVTKKELVATPVSLPNVPEQNRIVSQLDQAFEAIDQAIANTEKNIENVDELFQSQLDFLFSCKDDSWSTNVLSEIATLKYGYTEKSADTGHYRYIRITDIDKQGKLRTETKQYLAYSPEAEEYLLKHNDLLMARTGATYGKVLLYDNIEPSVYASYLIRIDFNIPLDNEVYWFFSKSKSYWKQATQLSSGSAQPQFNGNALKKVVLSYPNNKDDQEILKEKCKAIFELTDYLKQGYIAKLNELESLKMSILERAFKGELV